MPINFDKIRERLEQLRETDGVVKTRILEKLNSFYDFLHSVKYRDSLNFIFDEHLHFDLDYLRDLIDRYKKETSYLTQEDLVKVNKMYRKYKYHE